MAVLGCNGLRCVIKIILSLSLKFFSVTYRPAVVVEYHPILLGPANSIVHMCIAASCYITAYRMYKR